MPLSTVSPEDCLSITKSLWGKKLQYGDVWYAVSRKWYSHFIHFCGFEDKKKTTSTSSTSSYREDIIIKEGRGGGYPGPLSNGDLQSPNNFLQLREDAIENRDFVWVCKELYTIWVDQWFGQEKDSPVFERDVIRIGGNSSSSTTSELRIEQFPVFIKVCFCDSQGSADESTAKIWRMSRDDTLLRLLDKAKEELAKDSIGALDGPEARMWFNIKLKNQITSNANNNNNDNNNDNDKNNTNNNSNDNNNNNNNNADATNSQTTSKHKGNNDDEDEERPPDGWILLNDNDLTTLIGTVEFNHKTNDLHVYTYYMIEVQDDFEAWIRPTPVRNWRKHIVIGETLDVYDEGEKRWYRGKVVSIDQNNRDLLKIQFDGYDDSCNQDIDRNSERLAEAGTYVAEYYGFDEPGFSHQKKYYDTYSSYQGLGYSSYQDNAVPPRKSGCVGFRNIGNTCFLNSTLQCLCHCDSLHEFFVTDKYLKDINVDNPLGWKGEVAKAFGDLLKKYWSDQYNVLAPKELKDTIAKVQPRFSGFQQHDSSELLQFLLDGLHEDLNRVIDKQITSKIESDGSNDVVVAKESWEQYLKRNDSVVVENIMGQLRSYVRCPDCHKISVTFDPFIFLSVPISTKHPKQKTIEITTVLRDGHPPLTYAVRVNFLASVAELKSKLAEEIVKNKNREQRNVSPKQLILANVWNGRIHNLFEDYACVDEISEHDSVWGYEVHSEEELIRQCIDPKYTENNESKEEKIEEKIEEKVEEKVEEVPKPKFRVVTIYHQVTEKNTHLSTRGQYSIKDKGIPLLIKLPTDCDIPSKWLREEVEKMIFPYFDQKQMEQFAKTENNIDPIWVEPESFDASDPSDNENENEEVAKLFPSSDDDIEYFDFEKEQEKAIKNQKKSQKENEKKDEKENENEKENEISTEKNNESNTHKKMMYDIVCVSASVTAMCGICSSPTCTGCKLSALPSVKIINKFEVFRIAVRWALYANECFDHGVFLKPSKDLSCEIQESKHEETQPMTLNDCLDGFTQEETLSEMDAWYCSQCKIHKCATKKLDLWSLPKIVIIHLKRFAQSGYYREKDDTTVVYPQKLNLAQWVYKSEERKEIHGYNYELFAVSIHMGSLGGGHYIAYVKNLKSKEWFECDDSLVTSIDESKALTQNAYVLFYSRIDENNNNNNNNNNNSESSNHTTTTTTTNTNTDQLNSGNENT